MFQDFHSKRERFRDFFADSAKGFLLIWNTSRKLTIINFSLFFLQAIIPLLSLLALKSLIDQVIHDGINWQQSGRMLLLFAGLQLVNVIIAQFSEYYLAMQQQIIADDLAKKVLTKAIELDLEYYENPEFYDELHIAQQQSFSKPTQLIAACQGVIQNLTTILLFSGFMLMVHWAVLVLILILGIPLAISKLLHGYKQYQLDKNCMPAQRKAADIFNYLTTDVHAKEVRLFSFGANFIDQFLHLKQFIFSKKRQLHYKFLKQNVFIQFFEIAIITAIYYLLIANAVSGAITIGGLVIYLQVFQRLQAALASLFQSGISLFQQQLYLRHVLKYLAAPVTLAHQPGRQDTLPYSPGAITVNNLSFTYPQTELRVLQDINMTFKPGQITAIVGENGSGKTTLIKLLCRLYGVAENTIHINGTDISAIAPEELRSNITAIFQDFGKYYMTVEDNIILSNQKPDKQQRIEVAVEKSGLTDKLRSFPQGYDTHLGRTYRNGEQLSGGQWQKIAMARMFYKDSPIVILDEPTSSMDPVAEHGIFENLKKDVGNKIIILITHRLYNLKLADHIYVMEHGQVAEHGTFNELMNAKGAFANIYDKQII